MVNPPVLRWVKPPRQARSQHTLDRLLDAAEALVHEKGGFDDVPIAEIVRRAESSVGSFYSRFPDKDALLQAMGREPDAKKRLALWEKVQTLFYEDAARIKLGDYFRMDGRRAEVQGYQPGPYMQFWNVWLDRK